MRERTRAGGARRKGFIALGWLPAPAGGPERMRRAVRRARVATALGPSLAPHLLTVSVDSTGVAVIWMKGSGWERQLSTLEPELRHAIAGALGESVSRVEVRSSEAAIPTPPAPRISSDASPRERLTAAARRILTRRPDSAS